MAKTKKTKKESKLIYVPFIIFIAVLALILVLPSIKSPFAQPSSSLPFMHFQKVSNQDYASSPNTVDVYFISWEGCPYGATQSWPLYLALSHYGTINATPTWSDPEPLPTPSSNPPTSPPMPVPSLLFNSFTPNGSVHFHFFYMIGRMFTNNNSISLPNGTIIPYSGNSIVTLEQQELQKDVPSWVYNLIAKYELNTPFGQFPNLADAGNPPHIATALIITGPKGTWMIIGYDQSVGYAAAYYLATSGFTPQELYSNVTKGQLPNVTSASFSQIQAVSYIQDEENVILNIINQAMGTS
ncbi:DUF929 domain-containing protein [Stygiolobus caldivivus]|uniref:DUF929 domain-containing protein n=1 Tax=Stygiolobus caldivivus TaxID=2824673 RepID=A0A8D5U887_9CREN|nr:DUF929 domain-containing protein [Stygiolobus caldivivus]BCU71007.1 hypothetical protein KN1_23040 [Stygiolobus caldivivus]